MINVTLLMRTRRSTPAISTPSVKALRTVITIPNSMNAIRIDSSVKVVRILRRQMFIQIRGRNFTAGRFLPEHLSRDAAFFLRDPRHADRVSPSRSFCRDRRSTLAADQESHRWLFDRDRRWAHRTAEGWDR